MRRTYSKILMITLWLTIAVPVVAMTSSMPVSNGKLSSDFGERCGHYHKGIDISIKEGVVVRSAFDGEIVKSSYNEGGYGNYVVIRHEKGIEKPEKVVIRTQSLYMHELMKSKKFHHSQKETKAYGDYDDGSYGEFELFVEYNRELKGKILTFGEGLKVIAPERLVKEIKDSVERLSLYYK